MPSVEKVYVKLSIGYFNTATILLIIHVSWRYVICQSRELGGGIQVDSCLLFVSGGGLKIAVVCGSTIPDVTY